MSPRKRVAVLDPVPGFLVLRATARLELGMFASCPVEHEEAVRVAVREALVATLEVNHEQAVAGAIRRGVPEDIARDVLYSLGLEATNRGPRLRMSRRTELTVHLPPPDRAALVVGIDPFDRVVALPESECEELAAFNLAETWGEFRRKAPPAFRAAKEEEWLEVQECRGEGGEPAELPPDEAPFGKLDFPGVEDGDWPFPIQSMTDQLPLAILMRHGEPVTTRLNGDYVDIPPFALEDFVRDLELCGYSCRRDDAAICAASLR